MNLGGTIKSLREKKGIKQKDLAESSKISATYLSQIENNAKEPNTSTIKSICEVLDIPLPVLYFLSIDDSDVVPSKKKAFDTLLPSIKSMVNEFFTN